MRMLGSWENWCHLYSNEGHRLLYLPSQLRLKNTPTIFLQRSKTPHNECPWYDTKQSEGVITAMVEPWGMQSYPSLPLLLDPFWPGVVETDRHISVGQIELTYVLMLKWIPWKKSVLTFKLHSNIKLNCFKWKCFCMLNWIVWYRTVFDIETVFVLKLILWNISVY